MESDAEIDGSLEEYWRSDNDSDGCEVLEGADSSKETNDDTLEAPLKKPKVESDLEKFMEVGKIYNSNCH